MIKLKQATFIVLLTLALSTTFAVLSTTSALADDAERQKAEALIGILEANNISILNAFSDLESQGITAPSTAETKYSQALTHATEATNLMNTGNYSGAGNEAVEAMQLFKEALTLLQDASQTEPSATVVAAENITRIKAALNQAFSYVERLENLSAKAYTAGYNTTVLDVNISAAKSHLETAADYIADRNYDGAVDEIRAAKAMLVELKDPLNRLTQAVKVANVEAYLQEAEDRLAETESILNSTSLSPEVRDEAIDALNTSKDYLADARDSLANSNADAAITELEEAKKWEDETNNVLASATSVNSSDSTPNSLTSTG